MSSAKVSLPLHVVSDGMEADSYLEGTGPYSDRSKYPIPSLILLDLKMPRKSGLAVLEGLREQPSFRDLKILMLTSSSENEDIRTAYASGADLYIVKPIGMDKLRQLVCAITSYWNDLEEGPQKHLSGFATPRPKSSGFRQP